MRNIKEIKGYHVVSEPGDCTRYDFLVHLKGDTVIVSPYNSTFKFPENLDIFDIENITTLELAIQYCGNFGRDLNPHTLLEVCNSVRAIYDLEKNINK